jgi:hypothetical protein
MRKRAGPLAEISLEFAEIIGGRDENFSIWTRQPSYRDEVKQVLPFNLGRTNRGGEGSKD